MRSDARALTAAAWFEVAMLAASSLAAVACGNEGAMLEPATCEDQHYGTPRTEGEPDDALLAERARCAFQTDTTTAVSLGPDAPRPTGLAHVVVLLLENRSFDHYFSDLPSAGVTDVDVAPLDASNPDARGGTVTRFPADSYCIGNEVNHEWSDAHLQLNNGKLNGFVAASTRNAMAYYEQRDLPTLYALARNFATSDRHFSSLLGPTWANRLFFMAGTTCGYAEGGDTNPNVTLDCGLTHDTLLRQLDRSGHSYRVYDESGPFSVWVGLGLSGIPAAYGAFVDDVRNDTLPEVAIVGGNTGVLPAAVGGAEDDDHPPSDIRDGQRFLHDVVTTLLEHPAVWKNTVLFVTYDEHGGFFDHVRPPPACNPLEPTVVYDYSFNQYGFRVPLLIVSPFVKRGYVSHADTDHTSMTRFIQHWLGLGALSKRDANAWPFLDAFDFEHPDTSVPDLAEPPAPPAGGSCARTP